MKVRTASIEISSDQKELIRGPRQVLLRFWLGLHFGKTNFWKLRHYCMHTNWTRLGYGRVRNAIFKNSFLRNEGSLKKRPKYVSNIFQCNFTEKFVKSKSVQHLPRSPCKSGEYGAWDIMSYLIFSKYVLTGFATSGRALSRSQITLCVLSPNSGRFRFNASFNFIHCCR